MMPERYDKTLEVFGIWIPGTCEADLICDSRQKPEAQPCSEGHICRSATNAINALDLYCPPGYWCPFGSTEDISLVSPSGKFETLCEEGYECGEGTGEGQKNSKSCP